MEEVKGRWGGFVMTRCIFYAVCPYMENEMGWTRSTPFLKKKKYIYIYMQISVKKLKQEWLRCR